MPTNTYTSSQPNRDAPQAVLILSGDGFNELELFYPYYRLCEAGYKVDIVSTHEGSITSADGHKADTTAALAQVSVADYELLYLPGGKAPAKLRQNKDVLDVVRRFEDFGKPIAAICHGAQLLVSAGLAHGRTLAAWPDVEEEITQAGGTFKNAQLVEDGPYITARWPGDLPVHMAAVMKRLAELRGARAAA